MDVEIFTAGSYDGIIQALASDQIDFAFFASSAYAAAYTESNGGVRPLLASLEADGSTGYYSVIVTRCDGGLNTVDDLQGKVLAFADPDSTSGYAMPHYNLAQQGYDPTTFFSAVPFSGSHGCRAWSTSNSTPPPPISTTKPAASRNAWWTRA